MLNIINSNNTAVPNNKNHHHDESSSNIKQRDKNYSGVPVQQAQQAHSISLSPSQPPLCLFGVLAPHSRQAIY